MSPLPPSQNLQPVKELCQRCKATFECRASLPIPCDCSRLKLSSQAFEYIRQQGYTGCLCNKCLSEIEQQVARNS